MVGHRAVGEVEAVEELDGCCLCIIKERVWLVGWEGEGLGSGGGRFFRAYFDEGGKPAEIGQLHRFAAVEAHDLLLLCDGEAVYLVGIRDGGFAIPSA